MKRDSKMKLRLNRETLRVLIGSVDGSQGQNNLTNTSCRPHCTCPIGPGAG